MKDYICHITEMGTFNDGYVVVEVTEGEEEKTLKCIVDNKDRDWDMFYSLLTRSFNAKIYQDKQSNYHIKLLG